MQKKKDATNWSPKKKSAAKLQKKSVANLQKKSVANLKKKSVANWQKKSVANWQKKSVTNRQKKSGSNWQKKKATGNRSPKKPPKKQKKIEEAEERARKCRLDEANKFWAGFESAKNILVLDFDLAGKEVKERWTKITEARIRAEIEQNLQQERLDIDLSRLDLLDYVLVS